MACVSINGLILNGSHHFNSKLSVFTITTKINAMKGAWFFFLMFGTLLASSYVFFCLFFCFWEKKRKWLLLMIYDLPAQIPWGVWVYCYQLTSTMYVFVFFCFLYCFFFLGAFHLIIGSVKLHYLNISSLQRCRLVQHCCTNVFHVFQTCI